MTLARRAVLGVVLLALAAAGWFGFGRTTPERVTSQEVADPQGRQATLYCEFADVAGRMPVVGFYFLIEETKALPSYALIVRREKDGPQPEPGKEGALPPEWRFDGAKNPSILRAPDDATAINLYEYDPMKPSTRWFEAGLRDGAHQNLCGRCRRSAA